MFMPHSFQMFGGVGLPNDHIAFWQPSLISGSTLPDATGNHNATLNGDAQKDGDWLLLDGSGDYAVALDSSDWDSAAITLYAEFKCGTQSGNSGTIMSRDFTSSAPDDRVFWFRVETGGELRILIWNAADTLQSVTTTETFDDDFAHKAAVSIDGSKIKIIVDGAKLKDVAQTVTLDSASNEAIRIGMRDRTSGGTPAYFDGRLGDMGFWDYAIDESTLISATA